MILFILFGSIGYLVDGPIGIALGLLAAIGLNFACYLLAAIIENS